MTGVQTCALPISTIDLGALAAIDDLVDADQIVGLLVELVEDAYQRKRTDVGEVHHASASFDVAKRSMRPGSCVETRNAQLGRRSSSSRSSSAAPSSSRPL